MSTTDQDVRALEHIAMRLRQDTYGCKPWDAEGTHVVFARELKGMHLPTAVELVLHHACDPDAKTPAAIKRPFRPELPTAGPPPQPRCEKHPSQYAATCGQCEAEERYANGASDDARADGLAACRAAIRRGTEEDQ